MAKTLTENITQAIADFDGIAAAIINKGIEVPLGTPTSAYADKIRAIASGSSGWQPRPDWFDIDTIFDELYAQDNTLRAVLLINNANDVALLSSLVGGVTSRIKTSDGFDYSVTISNDIEHTWDKSKDKPTALGYSTRWIAVYCTKSIPLFLNAIDCLYACVGVVDASDIYGNSGNNTNTSNKILQSVSFKNYLQVVDFYQYAFFHCYSLQKMDIPMGIGSLNGQVFHSCRMLSAIIFDSSVNIASNALNGCYSLRKIIIPENSSLASNAFNGCTGIEYIKIGIGTTMANNTFNGCAGLQYIDIDEGCVLVNNLILSSCTNLIPQTFEDWSERLGVNTAANRNITTTSAIYDQVSNDAKQRLSAKGYMLIY